jgi:DNA (cytosine-5)-methyltransferase 3A
MPVFDIETDGLNVLSLFDGMSCGQIALQKAGVKVANYYASEIKKSAIKCTQSNYPNTVQLGDVTKIKASNLPRIDLLIGGSPCQDFSRLKVGGLGLEGDKSKLFYEYIRLKQEVRPKYFLLENVQMKSKSEFALNDYLGVEGLHINSSLVSYQKRPRVYWTNIPKASCPLDRNVSFQDYKETNIEVCKRYALNKTPSRERMWNNGLGNNSLNSCANVTYKDKIYCLTRKQDRSPNSGLVALGDWCRYLTRGELEQAQTVPLGYTKSVSINQAQDLLGDGWTVDVIAHLFKGLNGESNASL